MKPMTSAIWPLFGLRVSTPRLALAYVTDDHAGRLADLAADGIHDPATMPFSEPWTDVAPPEQQRNTLRYLWRCRSETTTAKWALTLAVEDGDGCLVGLCTLDAEDFTTTRSASTGSWLGRSHQGRGLGRETRQAALHLLFAGLGGETATTRAWHDNPASLGVTGSLPYTEREPVVMQRRGQPDTMRDFAMTRQQWSTVRHDDIRIDGAGPVREFLGIATTD